MTAPRDVLIEAGRLSAERRPYAFATVVRVERPASAREGNHALIKPDGAVVGWIGGACSGPAVVREALEALGDGRPRLVAIEGSCASEGLVEVFIEPQLPEPLLAIAGESPAAETLADLAARIGWRVVREVDPAADAVVVASLGTDDEPALVAALATPAGYIGLVASQRRGRPRSARCARRGSARRRSPTSGARPASTSGRPPRRRSRSRSSPSSSRGGTAERSSRTIWRSRSTPCAGWRSRARRQQRRPR